VRLPIGSDWRDRVHPTTRLLRGRQRSSTHAAATHTACVTIGVDPDGSARRFCPGAHHHVTSRSAIAHARAAGILLFVPGKLIVAADAEATAHNIAASEWLLRMAFVSHLAVLSWTWPWRCHDVTVRRTASPSSRS
jgi:hypothetical protein